MWSKACRRGTLAFWLLLGIVPSSIVYESQVAAEEKKIDAARARELFNEAMTLQAAGDYASALSKLQQVATFKNTPQVRFNIAVCQEKLGRLVVALGEYRIAVADAEQDPKARSVVDAATKAIASLEPKIPTLTLTRTAGASSARISVDGNLIADAMIGKPIPMDPGHRVIEAESDGGNFRKEVDLELSSQVSVEVSLSAKPSAAPSASAAASSAVPEVPKTPAEHSGGSSTIAWVSMGIGVVGLAASGYFYARRSSLMDDLDKACGPSKQSCSADMKSKYDDGKSATTMGNLALGVGVAGVLTGIVLFATSGGGSTSEVTAPAASETPKETGRLRLQFVPAAANATLGGASILGRF